MGQIAIPFTDVVGYSAAFAVLVAFCMSAIVPLRIDAIMSNVLFASYGLLAHLYPVVVLHAILLPINLLKLVHVESLARDGWPVVCRVFSRIQARR
jgi:CRP/FNR family cyclic AMP-dependent transcriptional regulator